MRLKCTIAVAGCTFLGSGICCAQGPEGETTARGTLRMVLFRKDGSKVIRELDWARRTIGLSAERRIALDGAHRQAPARMVQTSDGEWAIRVPDNAVGGSTEVAAGGSMSAGTGGGLGGGGGGGGGSGGGGGGGGGAGGGGAPQVNGAVLGSDPASGAGVPAPRGDGDPTHPPMGPKMPSGPTGTSTPGAPGAGASKKPQTFGPRGSSGTAGPTPTGTGSGPLSVPPFTYHWAVRSNRPAVKRGEPHYADLVDLTDTPIQKDVAFLYASEIGDFPHEGPHVADTPEWAAMVAQRIPGQLDRHIPDPEFDGLAIIDYESWWLVWERATDQHQNWERHIRAKSPGLLEGFSAEEREAFLRESYETVVEKIFLTTLRECQRLRPNAKWGFFRYPVKLYYSPETPRGVIGYGDHTHQASVLNDRLDWLWSEVDVLAPNIYVLRRTVENPRNWSIENSAEHDRQYILSNLAEAKRVAKGKPVYAFTWFRYQAGENSPLYHVSLNEANLRSQLMLPEKAGVDGVIIWDDLESEPRRASYERYVRRQAVPIMRELLDSLEQR